MTDTSLLRPIKGHLLYLTAAIVCAVSALALTIATVYYAFVAHVQELTVTLIGWVVLLWIITLPLAWEPGRFVAFLDESRLSLPTLFPRRNPRFVTARDIDHYEEIGRAADVTQPKVLVLVTKAGKRLRYSNARTPGCIPRLVSLMQQWGIPEKSK